MNLFKSLFGGSRNDDFRSEIPSIEPEARDFTSTPNDERDLRRDEFVTDATPGYKIGTVSYGTGAAIDAIYAFISRDYESQGFDDAMVTGDMSYRKTKEALLRNSLKQLFGQVKLRYQDDIARLQVQIKTAEEQMLNNAVLSLKTQIESFGKHLKEIEQMERDLQNNDPKMTIMIDSYTRGFIKGISAQSMGMLKTPNQE